MNISAKFISVSNNLKKIPPERQKQYHLGGNLSQESVQVKNYDAKIEAGTFKGICGMMLRARVGRLVPGDEKPALMIKARYRVPRKASPFDYLARLC